MICPNCKQEMIDIKDYCINCGKELRKHKKEVSLITLFIIFTVMILIGALICYLIVNYNTDKEIEPYINKADKTTE